MLHRRLARDYEALPERSEAMIHLAMTDLMARRPTGEATISWPNHHLLAQPHKPASTTESRMKQREALPSTPSRSDRQEM